jgi:threonine dehydratase
MSTSNPTAGKGELTLRDTEEALARVRAALDITPLTYSTAVSELTGRGVSFKWDNRMRTGSFKERGAVNVLASLAEGSRQTVCAASAGNHALALSHHARRLGMKCVLVMPKNAPLVKVQAARSRGAEILLEGGTFDEAYRAARGLAEEKGYVFVSPFDDQRIMAGQSTLAYEVVAQCADFDSIIVPVGGGGLISGIAYVMKALRPEVFVLGVQSEWSTEAHRSGDRSGPRITPATIADGIAVKTLGTLTRPVIDRYVDEMVQVSENIIASSIIQFLELEHTVVEGAGAAALAALLHGYLPERYRKPVVVVSGSNIDMNLLARLIPREIASRGHLVKVRLSVPDRPGSLHTVSGIVAGRGANVLEVHHDRSFSSVPGNVEITVTLEVRDGHHREEVLESLEAAGISSRQI